MMLNGLVECVPEGLAEARLRKWTAMHTHIHARTNVAAFVKSLKSNTFAHYRLPKTTGLLVADEETVETESRRCAKFGYFNWDNRLWAGLASNELAYSLTTRS